MSRRPALAVGASCLLTILVPCVCGSEAEEKAQKAFDTLFGADYQRAVETERGKAIALAAKFLAAAEAKDVHPGLAAILCEKAYELASPMPGGDDTAAQAMEMLAGRVPEKEVACREKVTEIRERQYRAAKGPNHATAGDKLIEALLLTAAAQSRTGAATEAVGLCRRAMVVARTVKSDRKDEIQTHLDRYAAREKLEKDVTALKTQVEADPKDAAARQKLMLLLLVDLDDPARAAVYLDESCGEDVRKYLPAVAKGVNAAPELACMELGDWYWKLAQGASASGKVAMQLRARAYYMRFLDLHKDDDVARSQAVLAIRKANESLADKSAVKGPRPSPARATSQVAQCGGNAHRTGETGAADVLQMPKPRWQLKLSKDTKYPLVADTKKLYWSEGNPDETGSLYSVDAATGNPVILKLPFKAHSYALADGVLYAHTTRKERDGKVSSAFVALDLRTSKQRWSIPTNEPGEPPTVNEGLVCFAGKNLMQVADLADGGVRWKVQAKDTRFGVYFILAGPWACSIQPTNIGVLDASAGNMVSHVGREGAEFLGLAYADKTLFVMKSEFVFAVEAATGKELWALKAAAGEPFGDHLRGVYGLPGPLAVGQGTVYAGLETAQGGALMALDAKTGQVLWRFETKEGVPVAPVIGKKAVYFGTGAAASSIFAVDAASGRLLWKLDAKAKFTLSWPVLLAGDGLCFAKDGVLYGLK